jgi:hypothetical protein
MTSWQPQKNMAWAAMRTPEHTVPIGQPAASPADALAGSCLHRGACAQRPHWVSPGPGPYSTAAHRMIRNQSRPDPESGSRAPGIQANPPKQASADKSLVADHCSRTCDFRLAPLLLFCHNRTLLLCTCLAAARPRLLRLPQSASATSVASKHGQYGSSSLRK